MEFQEELFLHDYMYDSSDSDKIFRRGEDEDEGFCDSDDNASNAHPTIDEVKVDPSSSKKQQEDDAGYGDVFDKLLLNSTPNFLGVLQADPMNQQIPSDRELEDLPLFEGDLLSASQYVDMPEWNNVPVEQNVPLEKHDTGVSMTVGMYHHQQQQPHPYGYPVPTTTSSATTDILDGERWQGMVPTQSDSPLLFGSSAPQHGRNTPQDQFPSSTSQPTMHSTTSSTSSTSTLKLAGGEPSPVPGFSEDDLVSIPYNDFKALLKRFKLSASDASKAKEMRKRGKNRAAAQNCRKNKVRVISSLEVEVQDLRQQLSECSHERDSLIRELQVLKNRRDILQYQSNSCHLGGHFTGGK